MGRYPGGSLLAMCAVLVVGTGPAPARAQEGVRVVEMVAETTGDRRRHVVADLDEGEIRRVQSALRDAGYVGIGWTGRLDDGTREGLRRFQEDRGLVECGCVSYETIVALGIRPDVVATVSTPDGNPSRDHLVDLNEAGWIFAVPVPVLVPRPCPDGCGPGAGAPTGAPAPPGTAAPPGVRPPPPAEPRPAPPPARPQG